MWEGIIGTYFVHSYDPKNITLDHPKKEDVKSFFVVVGALVSFTTIFVWHFTLSRCSLCKIQWRKLHHQICRKPPQFSWKFS